MFDSCQYLYCQVNAFVELSCKATEIFKIYQGNLLSIVIEQIIIILTTITQAYPDVQISLRLITVQVAFNFLKIAIISPKNCTFNVIKARMQRVFHIFFSAYLTFCGE